MTQPLHVSKRLCRKSQEVPGEKQKALPRMLLKQRFKEQEVKSSGARALRSSSLVGNVRISLLVSKA